MYNNTMEDKMVVRHVVEVEVRAIGGKSRCEWNIEARDPSADYAFEPCGEIAKFQLEIITRRSFGGPMNGGISFVFLCPQHYHQFEMERVDASKR